MEQNNVFIPQNGITTVPNLMPSIAPPYPNVCPGCGRCRDCGQHSAPTTPAYPQYPSYPGPWTVYGLGQASQASGWTGAVALNFYK